MSTFRFSLAENSLWFDIVGGSDRKSDRVVFFLVEVVSNFRQPNICFQALKKVNNSYVPFQYYYFFRLITLMALHTSEEIMQRVHNGKWLCLKHKCIVWKTKELECCGSFNFVLQVHLKLIFVFVKIPIV